MGTPVISGDTAGSVTENSGLSATGDLDNTGFWSSDDDDLWSISDAATYGTAAVDATTGEWSYSLDESHPALDELGAGETLTDTFTVHILDDNGGVDTQVVSLTINGVPCFTAGTMIATDRGARPVEDICAGDLVQTLDNGLQRVRWAGCRAMQIADWQSQPELRPILIRANALGTGQPAVDLIVSPQHRILVDSVIAGRVFGAEQMLIAAVKLLDLAGVSRVSDPGALSYHHLLFDRHEVILSNGAASESLFTGPEAMKSLSAEARGEIESLFPELAQGQMPFAPARPIAHHGKQIREFTQRLSKNRKSAMPPKLQKVS